MGGRPKRTRHDITPAQLADLLGREYVGPENTITSAAIAARFALPTGGNGRPELPGSREVTELVERAQRAGYPITRNHQGFFYATEPAHFDFEITDYQNRIAAFRRHIESVEMARSRV